MYRVKVDNEVIMKKVLGYMYLLLQFINSPLQHVGGLAQSIVCDSQSGLLLGLLVHPIARDKQYSDLTCIATPGLR